MIGVADAIYNWLLDFEREIGVEYLGPEVGCVSIESVPGNVTVRRYVDGGEVRQFLFVIALREEYGGDTADNLAAARFFSELEAWIMTRDRAGELPKMDGAQANSIECLSSGYVISNTQRSARYQIQCRLTYEVKGW